jgi:hypothetical protein
LEVNDEPHDHEADRAEFEGTYYKLKSDMERLLATWETVSRSVAPKLEASSSLENTTGSDITQTVRRATVKLPSISLPTFEGKYENWATFENIFKVMVDSQTDITSIEKFSYLLLALKGQAFQLVQGLPITTDNYSIAWNLLVDRYENKKLIAATHVRQLLGLKSISKEDVGEMRQFVNTFCSNSNALKALNIEQPLEDIILSQLLVERLDSQTRR